MDQGNEAGRARPVLHVTVASIDHPTPPIAWGAIVLAYAATGAILFAAPPAWAQPPDGAVTSGAVVLAIALVAAPALVGIGADWAIRLCRRLLSAAIPYGTSIRVIRQYWATRPSTFAKANIATIAVPLIDECRPKGGTIRLIGGDGAYVTGKNKKRLKDAIQTWVVEGDMRVEYLLVKPAGDAVRELKEVRANLADKEHMLSIFRLQKHEDMPDETSRLASFLVTYHPNLVSWPGADDHVGSDTARHSNRAMWLEGRHLPGESVSYDNRWVPPCSMQDIVPGHANGSAMTWNDVFSAWEEAFDDLKRRATIS